MIKTLTVRPGTHPVVAKCADCGNVTEVVPDPTEALCDYYGYNYPPKAEVLCELLLFLVTNNDGILSLWNGFGRCWVYTTGKWTYFCSECGTHDKDDDWCCGRYEFYYEH